MRPKVSVFIATSADGLIARRNGAIDWLQGDGSCEPEDFGYDAFIATVDALVMGRNTFEKVLTFDKWPYEGTPLTVLSTSLIEKDIPSALRTKVAVSSKAPAALLDGMATMGIKHIYLDGGKTIQGFLRVGLVDEMIISRLPILLGDHQQESVIDRTNSSSRGRRTGTEPTRVVLGRRRRRCASSR